MICHKFHRSRSIINELFKSREEILYFVLESCESIHSPLFFSSKLKSFLTEDGN